MIPTAEAEDLVIEALTTTFADHPALAQAADGPQDTVRMWCTIAGAVLRHAATAPDRTPGAALTDADRTALTTATQATLELVNTARSRT